MYMVLCGALAAAEGGDDERKLHLVLRRHTLSGKVRAGHSSIWEEDRVHAQSAVVHLPNSDHMGVHRSNNPLTAACR
jgi:hypothetical protein